MRCHTVDTALMPAQSTQDDPVARAEEGEGAVLGGGEEVGAGGEGEVGDGAWKGWALAKGRREWSCGNMRIWET